MAAKNNTKATSAKAGSAQTGSRPKTRLTKAGSGPAIDFQREENTKKVTQHKKPRDQSLATGPVAKVKKTAPKRQVPKLEVSKKKKADNNETLRTSELKESLIPSSPVSSKSKSGPFKTAKRKSIGLTAKPSSPPKTAVPRSKPLNKSQKKFQMKLDRAQNAASGGKSKK
ncbi:hypothetical protein GNI_064430 [Gregarina niphandrodes]|uniref:Uncharacterized protein n=1 Tax=Gregarina niphandrodes TaxID=110365 RepID=A0A023B7X3_GRENI|nr:hypothetical protein GNI_064430 [Gregarina niphandrodes]EZG68114.1 hypothetical protein GNI_064430 [Gregarina niphandrodes]|eukprot:XP_011130099.1 hypothetical protein GNI_064430 [Gregarina niphandrodes]